MSPERPARLKVLWRELLKELRWLTPGLGVKRWILLILIGTTLIALGFAILLIDYYRTAPETWFKPWLSVLSLRVLTRPVRFALFGGAGIGLVVWGIWGLNRTLLKPFIHSRSHLLDSVTAFRRKERGPRIVAIGGGTGLSSLLRGLKLHTSNLTAIVTVADDGGSSGELRRSMGVLPPGDIRNCLAALSDDETLITQIFQYRFGAGAGLNGHTLGNLFITALADITGSFEEAVAESGRVLAVKGRVLPSTLHDVRMVADVMLPDGTNEVRVKGESAITHAGGNVRRVWLEPNNPLAFPPAVQAILTADLVIVGPGSLFTSLLPNLLVTDLAEALRATRAQKFYVCNVATQKGETDGYTCSDHIRTIEAHVGENLFDLMVCNNRKVERPPQDLEWVEVDANLSEEYPAYATDLLDMENPRRHDSSKLAQVIVDLFYDRTGPLSNRDDEAAIEHHRA